MLTWYLNANKTVSRKYYRSCIRVLLAYLFFSVITILFRRYYLHEDLTWLQWMLKVLDFSAIPYGWYINMWIGLFLLTPFLNMMYKAIPTRRQKLLLIGILAVLTAAVAFFNHREVEIIPDYWSSCFPLMYFFIGSYIREYQPAVVKSRLFVVLALACLAVPVYNVVFSEGRAFYDLEGYYFGIFVTTIAVAVFLLLYKADFSSPWLRAALMKVSVLSLDMYLCCYMMDRLVYPYFLEHYFVDQSQFGVYFFVIVPILFAGSFAIAWVKDTVCKRVSKQL